MSRFRKKPLEIEAERLPLPFESFALPGQTEVDRVVAWCGGTKILDDPADPRVAIRTTHGDVAYARPGDWIVPDSKPGTFYPIAPEVFERTYDPVPPEE